MIGVLCVQGAFGRHVESFESLGADVIKVRKAEHLTECTSLVLPGGESTTCHVHLKRNGLAQAIVRFAEQRPVFGTCCGLILMQALKLMDIEVVRNGYGRQLNSFSSPLQLSIKEDPFHGVFIRAPRIRSVGKSVKILAHHNDEPVLVQQGNRLAATFHPELTQDQTIHRYFQALATD